MDNNKQNNTNAMAILGFIFSFFVSLLGLIFSIIALKQIKKSQEEGKGLAIGGLVISIIKIVIALFIIGLSLFVNLFFHDAWGNMRESIIKATCSQAKSCTYDATSGKYTCIIETENGTIDSFTCDKEYIPDFINK